MSSQIQLMIDVGRRSIEAVLAHGDLWFSQSWLAAAYETTTQNINIHLARLAQHFPSPARYFAIRQYEGSRAVCRRLKHFNLEVAHAIGIRAQRYDELNCLIACGERHGVLKRSYRVVPLQERIFEAALFTTLKGITPVERQFRVLGYRIDFFLPECNLAIEYDESHHAKPLQSRDDQDRQRQIESLLGVKFIRVREGQEFLGINRVLRHILSCPNLLKSRKSGVRHR